MNQRCRFLPESRTNWKEETTRTDVGKRRVLVQLLGLETGASWSQDGKGVEGWERKDRKAYRIGNGGVSPEATR